MIQTLGDYNVLERMGDAGLGEVYRARDTRRGRTVAVHIVGPAIASNAERRERFLRAARAATALSHPNIAAIYEVAEDQGQLFLVCEFVPGVPIGKLIAERPMNARRALDLAMQMADALADAHAAEIVHRDICGDTVVVTPKDKAKILHFGLSDWITADAASVAPYRSPERAKGTPVDGRADIFSLGVLLFEMLTGKRPSAPPPPPSTLNPSLPREIDSIVAKALAPNADDRIESAALLSAELRTVAALLDVRSEAAEAAHAMSRRKRERSYAGWLLVIAILAGLAAYGWWRWGG